MKNIHVLPTDKPSRLHNVANGNLILDNDLSYTSWYRKHIYITSDEEIKEEDWFYLDDAKIIAKYINVKPVKEAKKIILTTDQDLIKDGVQAIDDKFLEWFVKNPSCEEVEVEVIDDNIQWYKIIIPKEEHKGKALSEQEVMDNRSSAYDFIDVDKQETLEEDLKFPIIIESGLDYLNLTTKIFNNGAKWQQERSYSEEEVLVLLHKRDAYNFKTNAQSLLDWETPNEWFEQFKKK